ILALPRRPPPPPFAARTPLEYDDNMNSIHLEQLARQLLAGQLPLDEFLQAAGGSPTADLREAQLDLDRQRRCGYPEVVFGEGKPIPTLVKLFERLIAEKIDVLATRISAEKAAELAPRFPTGRYNAVARTFRIPLAGHHPSQSPSGHVVV